MANATKLTNTPIITPEPTNPEGVMPVYANNMGIAGTLTDVQMIFTQVRQGTGADGKLRPENAVSAMVVIPIAQVPQMINGLKAILQHHTALVEAQTKQKNSGLKN